MYKAHITPCVEIQLLSKLTPVKDVIISEEKITMGSYLVSTEGVVTELLPNILFRVQLSNGSEILGTPSRQMKKNYIPIEMGDHVEVAMTSPTATQGCIVGCLSHKKATSFR